MYQPKQEQSVWYKRKNGNQPIFINQVYPFIYELSFQGLIIKMKEPNRSHSSCAEGGSGKTDLPFQQLLLSGFLCTAVLEKQPQLEPNAEVIDWRIRQKIILLTDLLFAGKTLPFFFLKQGFVFSITWLGSDSCSPSSLFLHPASLPFLLVFNLLRWAPGLASLTSRPSTETSLLVKSTHFRRIILTAI